MFTWALFVHLRWLGPNTWRPKHVSAKGFICSEIIYGRADFAEQEQLVQTILSLSLKKKDALQVTACLKNKNVSNH